jgi:LysM domain-containing protein
MSPRWTQEAEDLLAVGSSGTPAGGPAKAVLHVTVSPSGGDFFSAMHRTLTEKKAEPHYLYDPVTDRLGQYFALDRSARALRRGVGARSVNKDGSRVIQVEVVAQATDPFTAHWRPGPNFRAMMRDIRANGVPDRFIARPARSAADAMTLRVSYDRYSAWSGWVGHCHVPGQNDPGKDPRSGHWDPGAIDTAAFFAGAPHAAPAHQNVARPRYVVEQGDNLTQIALRFHTTVAKLVSLNHIKDPDVIHPGDVLLLA